MELLLKIIFKLLGQYVTPELMEYLKDQIVAFLKEKAKESDNKIDDKIMKIIEAALK